MYDTRTNRFNLHTKKTIIVSLWDKLGLLLILCVLYFVYSLGLQFNVSLVQYSHILSNVYISNVHESK